MDIVYAKETVSVGYGHHRALRETLRAGDLWDPEAEIVKERPDLFVSEPPVEAIRGRVTRRGGDAPVETVTRAPGARSRRARRA